jgi:PAS domain S-box-containing protein
MADYDIEIMRKIKMINIMSITVFIQAKNAMRIIFFFLCAALLFSLSLLPRLAADETPLIFVGDQSYLPVESLKDGRPEGINIDVLQALSKAMGRKISIQLMLWNEAAQEKVLKGEADALTLMSPSDERRKLYDFSDPTLPIQYSIFVKSDNMTIHQVKDLGGKRVGVTSGGFPRKVLESNNRILLVFIKNYLEGFQLLLSGTIDAVGADTWVGAYTIQEHGIRGVKVAREPFANKSSCIAVKKGNVKLLNDINAGIKKLRNDGTIKQLIGKWSSKEVVFLTRERIRIILLVAIIMLFLAVAGAIIIWNKALREQVREKTSSLRNSEEKYHSLVDFADDSIYLVDRDCRYLFMNKKHLSRLGLTAEKAIGGKYSEFHSEDDTKDFVKKVEKVFKTGNSIQYEHRSPRDGRYFLATLSPVKEQGGRTISVSVISKNITALKQAEEELRQTRGYLENLINYANAPIIVWDPIMKITRFNGAFEHLTGYKAEDLVGSQLHALFPEASQGESLDKIERTLNGEFLESVEIPVLRKDGGIRIVLWSSANIYAQDGTKAIATIAQGTDITSRKQAEEQIPASLKEKEILLQEIHHRVKNNMQVISSLLKLQADTIKDETLREAFKESQNRVRAMSMIHEKLYQLEGLARVNFRDYLTSITRYLYQSYGTHPGGIKLKTDVEDLSLDISTAIPCGLIVNELISNSIKHAFPEGRKGTITISLHPAAENTIELTVSDNGIGLPDAIDPHTTQSLGLHLVSILTEDQLKGKVTLERSKGITFTLTFPNPKPN